MEEVNISCQEIENYEFNKSYYIEIYKLQIQLNSSNIFLEIKEMDKLAQSYEIQLNLEQIKEKHISFSNFSSLKDFLDCIEKSIQNQMIAINKISENIIRFEFKKNSIFFQLKKVKITLEKLVEDLKITNENFDTKISKLEKNYTELFNENKNLKQEINELKKKNEILFKENRKYQEELKGQKREKNLPEGLNNEILNIFNILIEKEEMKKQEDSKLDIKIIRLKKDIQDLKNEIDKLKIMKEKPSKKEIEINKNKNEKMFFRGGLRENENNNINNINEKGIVREIIDIFKDIKIKTKANNINIYEKNNDSSFSELNEHSINKRKFKLIEESKNNKYNNKYNNKDNDGINFDLKLNKIEQIYIQNNISPDIYSNNNIKNQMIDSRESFYKKNKKTDQGIIIEPYDYNTNTNRNNNNQIYKRHILLNQKKLFDNINKKNDIRYKKERFNNSKRSNSSNKKNSNNKSSYLNNDFYFIKNFKNNNEEKKVNDEFHIPKRYNKSAKKDYLKFNNNI